MSVISTAYGRADLRRVCALPIRDVAISSWALVIFLIDPAERMRPRNSRSVAAIADYFFFGAGLRTFTDSFSRSSSASASTCSSGTTELPSEAAKPFLNWLIAPVSFSSSSSLSFWDSRISLRMPSSDARR